MCLFNVNQTRGWKSPTSCPTAASKRVEGYAECLWGWKDMGEGRGVLVGFKALTLMRWIFFFFLHDPVWPVADLATTKRSKWWGKGSRGGSKRRKSRLLLQLITGFLLRVLRVSILCNHIMIFPWVHQLDEQSELAARLVVRCVWCHVLFGYLHFKSSIN